MQTTADLILFLGFAAMVIGGLAIVGWMEQSKREMARRRKDARHGATNYARIQAVMALGSGTIRGGKR